MPWQIPLPSRFRCSCRLLWGALHSFIGDIQAEPHGDEMPHEVREEISRASADFVRERTEFSIGGVPPIGHSQPVLAVVDDALLQYDRIWAAAGHANAVFALTPAELVKMTGGTAARVA